MDNFSLVSMKCTLSEWCRFFREQDLVSLSDNSGSVTGQVA